MNKVLVIVAHPDDEILGVGATIAKHKENGDEIRCIILGEGQTSRWNKREDADQSAVEELHKDTLDAAAKVGYSKIYFADFPDNRFDHVDLLDIVKFIEKIKTKFQPNIIYTHHKGDLNIDHQITFNAVLTATRPIGEYKEKEIYTFETLSSTEWEFSYGHSFKPNVFINIEKTLENKIEAMKCYRSELAEFPHPRSLEMLQISAKRWGSVIGREYAEAFMMIRCIK